MAVEILPAELARESSYYCSPLLLHYVPVFANIDHQADFEDLDLAPEIKRAVILWRGRLTPDYRYLEAHLALSALHCKKEKPHDSGTP